MTVAYAVKIMFLFLCQWKYRRGICTWTELFDLLRQFFFALKTALCWQDLSFTVITGIQQVRTIFCRRQFASSAWKHSNCRGNGPENGSIAKEEYAFVKSSYQDDNRRDWTTIAVHSPKKEAYASRARMNCRSERTNVLVVRQETLLAFVTFSNNSRMTAAQIIPSLAAYL